MNIKLISQYKGLRRENYILFIGRIVTRLGAMVWPVLTLILNQKMGLNATTVAFFMMAASVIQLPVNLIGGKLADRFNKKNVIVLCDAISITFYIICAFIPLSYVTLAMIMVAASCQTMEHASYDALLSDITLTEDRERAYSLMYLGSNLGLVASPTIAGLLFANYLWLSFLISGVAIAISTVLIYLYVNDITPVKETSQRAAYQNSKDNVSAFEILRENKVILLFILILALYGSAYNQYGYLMPMDMASYHGDLGAVIYGTISSLNCIVVVICTPFVTRILSKLTYTKKFMLGIVMVIIGYTVFLFGLGIIPSYYVAIFLFTLGEIITTISSAPYISERIPSTHRGRITSITSAMRGGLESLGMLVTGLLFDNVGRNAAWVFSLGILGLAFVLNFILIPGDRKTYPKLY